MQTVTIQLVAGPPVSLEVEDVQKVVDQLGRGAQYVRIETPGGVYFLNPAHVVSVNAVSV